LPVIVELLSDALDEYRITSVELMEIDGEQVRLLALQGTAPLLEKRQREFIVFECIEAHLRRFGADSEQLLAFFWQQGYRTSCLFRGRWRRISSLTDYMRCHASPDLIAVHPSTATWEGAMRFFRS
jgi:hypothetical protein